VVAGRMFGQNRAISHQFAAPLQPCIRPFV